LSIGKDIAQGQDKLISTKFNRKTKAKGYIAELIAYTQPEIEQQRMTGMNQFWKKNVRKRHV
jgi:hypothetical protein